MLCCIASCFVFICFPHFFRSFTDLWNNANVTTVMLQISVKYFCRYSKRRICLFICFLHFSGPSPTFEITLMQLQRCYKYRWSTFAATPNVAWIISVIWKDLLWRPDFSCYLKQRGVCTIPMFQLSSRCQKCVAASHNSVIGNKKLFANNRNRVRWVVLCLSQDGACTDSFENFRESSLKVPKRENFLLAFFALNEPIWVCDLEN